MKRRAYMSQRGSLGRRAVTACLLCAGMACVLSAGTLPATGRGAASSRTQAPESLRQTPTLAERVAYQYAIEEVYWRHRIWPKDNPQPKPPLDTVISRERIEKKVTDYLRK